MWQRPIKITDGFILRQDLTHFSGDLFLNTFCRRKVTFLCRGSLDILFGAQTEIHFLFWSQHDQHNLWLWVVRGLLVTWKLGFREINQSLIMSLAHDLSHACSHSRINLWFYTWINILYVLKCNGAGWLCCWEPWGQKAFANGGNHGSLQSQSSNERTMFEVSRAHSNGG